MELVFKTYLNIIIIFFVIFFIKIIPVLFLAHRKIPEKLNNIIIFLPISILTTVSVTEIIHNNAYRIFGIPIAIPAAIIAFITGYFSRNLFVAILSSVVAYFILQNI